MSRAEGQTPTGFALHHGKEPDRAGYCFDVRQRVFTRKQLALTGFVFRVQYPGYLIHRRLMIAVA